MATTENREDSEKVIVTRVTLVRETTVILKPHSCSPSVKYEIAWLLGEGRPEH